ncbi:Dihydrolipoyllysine-residue acetyltransferase component of pyruvate dehydrogenase complex [Pseudidiomarina piscicola]|uniref:Dihydrolipoamide acetyltransferase component of pyruvate dehydrogenase complex n=1 Tax=Pseudidiomarina piscicola TaxID=2614830 RepID=A0A6S6WL69_9GAMM|nr:dihydrolipoyllysine-residue acetyltransferase [Pseudidiomarina piscicola]CAB0150327.1 Dihydrolipoyllysine-residue acetyltransferase component of pyruvate dehydrogenase complex [Pseudidiomarina piscicola]VZT39755.1 Dihydrolipoyllysine-residue acetyltransferase component of pyruvate dehydrogenase complex [Pseudomonas aeruginosa]
MSKDFILPDIGEGIVECEIVEWLVQEGDSIKEDQPVVDVMTDKALVQIPAKDDGVVAKLYYQQGDIAKVHEPLFAIQGNDDEADTNAASEPAAEPAAEPATVSDSKPATGDTSVTDFILPDIGEGIVECEIVEWQVQEGDTIEEDQPVVDVMTDKALVQIPAKDHGVVEKLYYKQGDIAQVHEPLFAVRSATDNATDNAPQTSSATSAAQPAAADETSANSAAQPGSAAAPKAARQGKAIASPAVRRRARELDVDISQVTGSGAKGRVMKEDIEQFIAGTSSKAEAQSAAPSASASSQPTVSSGGKRTEAIRGVKAAMAKAMTNSVQTIPHFTYADEFDLTAVMALQKQLKERYKDEGVRITMMPFFIKALSLALKEFPVMNAQVNDDCTEITYFDDHNIGMAVDTKIGLLVPNVKQVQNKSLIDVANEVTRLTQSAREGRVAQEDMKGGTISISNIGVIGGTVATPIINKPEAAIVALGKVQELPRFDADGNVVARKMMTVSWSGDHRIIDGGTIARFNKRWQEFLEDPTSMLVHMV